MTLSLLPREGTREITFSRTCGSSRNYMIVDSDGQHPLNNPPGALNEIGRPCSFRCDAAFTVLYLPCICCSSTIVMGKTKKRSALMNSTTKPARQCLHERITHARCDDCVVIHWVDVYLFAKVIENRIISAQKIDQVKNL